MNFLPGLTFEFISNSSDAARTRGARLIGVDLQDPAFTFTDATPEAERVVLSALRTQIGRAQFDPVQRNWFMSSIKQGAARIELTGPDPDADGEILPFDGLTVWRLVRSLESGSLEIELTARRADENDNVPDPVTLQGIRRRYTDASTGVLSSVYQAGELTQSLCSPWQHDFRDCGCFYWASNHPDIVQVEDLPGAPVLSGGASQDPSRALTSVRWLRSDRSTERSSEARETYQLNRPIEMDHYEINLRWQELPIVVGNKEISSTYRPNPLDSAPPFANADEMAQRLVELATVEHVLTLEYLYAFFSIRLPGEIPDGPSAEFLREDVQFLRHYVQLVAVSEMQHLRWANQLIWELREDRIRVTAAREAMTALNNQSESLAAKGIGVPYF